MCIYYGTYEARLELGPNTIQWEKGGILSQVERKGVHRDKTKWNISCFHVICSGASFYSGLFGLTTFCIGSNNLQVYFGTLLTVLGSPSGWVSAMFSTALFQMKTSTVNLCLATFTSLLELQL